MDVLLPADLVALAERVVIANRAIGRRVALAESCTGGLVSAALTEIPGSSEVVEAGFVTYSNKAKIDLLGVSSELIETFGAVSTATAWRWRKGRYQPVMRISRSLLRASPAPAAVRRRSRSAPSSSPVRYVVAIRKR